VVGDAEVNPLTWPWQTWFVTVTLAVVASLLGAALERIIVSGWRATLHRPFWLLVANLKAGRHNCGHRSGSYVTHRDGRRVCWQCDPVEKGAAEARSWRPPRA